MAAFYSADQKIIADQLIPAADNKKVLRHTNYGTADIMTEVMSVYATSWQQLKAFAPTIKSNNVHNTCRNAWQFVKNNIAYLEDPEYFQFVKEPRQLWFSKVGDCKSYSIFIASLLTCLGIPFVFRFVSFTMKKIPRHVYIVCKYKNEEIILDAVMPAFNSEEAYNYKIDYMPQAKMYRISGMPKVGGFFDSLTNGIVQGATGAVATSDNNSGWLNTFLGDVNGVLQTLTPVVSSGIGIYNQVNNALNNGSAPGTGGTIYVNPGVNNNGSGSGTGPAPDEENKTPWGMILLGTAAVGFTAYALAKK